MTMTPKQYYDLREFVIRHRDDHSPTGMALGTLLDEVDRLTAELAGARAAQPDVCEWRLDSTNEFFVSSCGVKQERGPMSDVLQNNGSGELFYSERWVNCAWCGKPIRVAEDAGEKEGE